MNYVDFLVAIYGEPNEEHLSIARGALEELSQKQKDILAERKVANLQGLKMSPIYSENVEVTIDMNYYLFQFKRKRAQTKDKEEFIEFYKEHSTV